MNHLSFGLIGGGWRAEFFLRLARDLPGQFPLAGIVVRNPEKAAQLRTSWNVPVFSTTEELLARGKPAFVVTSLPWAANLPAIESLSAQGIPVLSETPIAPDLADLHRVFGLVEKGARIQVAEQYLFQPTHAARLALVRSGRLGAIHEADISCAHGYHGISLLRHYLGAGLRQPRVTARRFVSKIVSGPGRGGPPIERTVAASERVLAQFDYGDGLGVYDFTGDQYFSWIRSPRILVRGEEGEINQATVRLLRDFQTPLQFELERHDTGRDGNLEGHAHRAITGGGELLYQNPFPTARWSDDEIAVATSLRKMQGYVETGVPFYSVAEACQDRYLDILMGEALEKGVAIQAQPQPWN
jgi:predicted dehydrogenase